MKHLRSKLVFLVVILGVMIFSPVVGLQAQDGGGDWAAVAAERGLTDADIFSAVKTFTPSGVFDEYVMFASGGHSGQVFAIGLPSMRVLREIAVFTPEPWQGYGFGSGEDVLAGGNINGKEVRWGDTHHPALTETDGQYDGQYLFINDKANGRVAVIDLRDFETKQIVNNPLYLNDHAMFTTPSSDYVIQGGQYAMPFGGQYAPLTNYEADFVGMVTFWKFDREAGRINADKSFAIELPPYWQDLCDAGKNVSEGWIFCNTFNSELATGGIESGNPPFEAGASRNETDWMHIIDYKGAEALYEAGEYEMIEGMPVIKLETLIANGIIFNTPEPRSPHGNDVAPGGDFIVVSGKLAPVTTVYSFEKIQAAIVAGPTEVDAFGIPVLPFDDVMEAQVPVGLGPLHTQFDDQGYAYTSLFLDTAIAKWSLGGENYRPQDGWTVQETIPVQYNVGHLAVAGGDTVAPDGEYLVSLNKWSVDRFLNTGPLLPQNLQLIDISDDVDKMQVIYDMPMGAGEPHYAQIIRADRLNTWEVYPEVGWDAATQTVSADAVAPGEEGITIDGDTVIIKQTAVRSHFTPEIVEIPVGKRVIWTITNIEQAKDATHGFGLPYYGINLSLEPGETITFEFDADKGGVYSFYCTEFCSALHLEMTGYLMVQP